MGFGPRAIAAATQAHFSSMRPGKLPTRSAGKCTATCCTQRSPDWAGTSRERLPTTPRPGTWIAARSQIGDAAGWLSLHDRAYLESLDKADWKAICEDQNLSPYYVAKMFATRGANLRFKNLDKVRMR